MLRGGYTQANVRGAKWPMVKALLKYFPDFDPFMGKGSGKKETSPGPPDTGRVTC